MASPPFGPQALVGFREEALARLGSLLSPLASERLGGESWLRVSENAPGFAPALASVALPPPPSPDAAPEWARQLSLVLLRQLISRRWASEDAGAGAGDGGVPGSASPAPLEADRAAVRSLLPQALADPSPRVRTAAALAVAAAATASEDVEAEWPELLPGLVGAVGRGDALAAGSVSALALLGEELAGSRAAELAPVLLEALHAALVDAAQKALQSFASTGPAGGAAPGLAGSASPALVAAASEIARLSPGAGAPPALRRAALRIARSASAAAAQAGAKEAVSAAAAAWLPEAAGELERALRPLEALSRALDATLGWGWVAHAGGAAEGGAAAEAAAEGTFGGPSASCAFPTSQAPFPLVCALRRLAWSRAVAPTRLCGAAEALRLLSTLALGAPRLAAPHARRALGAAWRLLCVLASAHDVLGVRGEGAESSVGVALSDASEHEERFFGALVAAEPSLRLLFDADGLDAADAALLSFVDSSSAPLSPSLEAAEEADALADPDAGAAPTSPAEMAEALVNQGLELFAGVIGSLSLLPAEDAALARRRRGKGGAAAAAVAAKGDPLAAAGREGRAVSPAAFAALPAGWTVTRAVVLATAPLLALSFLRPTADQRTRWLACAEAFASDEDADFVTARAGALDLCQAAVESEGASWAAQLVAGLRAAEAVATQAAAPAPGDPLAWTWREAALLLAGSCDAFGLRGSAARTAGLDPARLLDAVAGRELAAGAALEGGAQALQSLAGAGVAVDLGPLAGAGGTADAAVPPGIPPLLLARSLWLCWRLASKASAGARAAGLWAAAAALGPDGRGRSPPEAVGACHAAGALLGRGAPPSAAVSVGAPILSRLIAAVESPSEDVSRLALEALAAAARALPAEATATAGAAAGAALRAWAARPEDPLLAPDAAAALEAVCGAGPAARDAALAAALPGLAQIAAGAVAGQAGPQGPTPAASGALWLAARLARSAGAAGARAAAAAAAPAAAETLLRSSDEDSLRAAAALAGACLEGLGGGGGGSGPSAASSPEDAAAASSAAAALAPAAARLLATPSLGASSAGGDLALQVLRAAGASGGGDDGASASLFASLLAAAAAGLAADPDALDVNGAVSLLCYALASRPLNAVRALEGAGPGALRAALLGWLQRARDLTLKTRILLSLRAAAALLPAAVEAVEAGAGDGAAGGAAPAAPLSPAALTLPGRRLDTPATSGIRTRARAAREPERWSEVSLAAKLCLVLVDAFIEEAAQSSGTKLGGGIAELMEQGWVEIDDDDDDDEWEEDDGEEWEEEEEEEGEEGGGGEEGDDGTVVGASSAASGSAVGQPSFDDSLDDAGTLPRWLARDGALLGTDVPSLVREALRGALAADRTGRLQRELGAQLSEFQAKVLREDVFKA